MTVLDLGAARAHLAAATNELDGLCSGDRRWTMRIPAREDWDSDLVFAAALKDLGDALDELAELRRPKPAIVAQMSDGKAVR